MEPIENLINFFDLPLHYLYNLLSHKLRNTNNTIRDNQPKRFEKVVTFEMKAICPRPSQDDIIVSYAGIMLKNLNRFKEMSKSYNKMAESLSLYMKASKYSSTEQHIIRALLCKNFTYR